MEQEGAGCRTRPRLGRGRLRAWAARCKRDVLTLWLAARDPRVGWGPRLLAGGVAAYAFSPIDLIPDFIPVLGLVDDLILVPLGIWAALRLIPVPLLAELRGRAAAIAARPVSRAAAVAIGALWVGAAAAVAALLIA